MAKNKAKKPTAPSLEERLTVKLNELSDQCSRQHETIKEVVKANHEIAALVAKLKTQRNDAIQQVVQLRSDLLELGLSNLTSSKAPDDMDRLVKRIARTTVGCQYKEAAAPGRGERVSSPVGGSCNTLTVTSQEAFDVIRRNPSSF